MCPYKILTVASIPIVCITFSENLTQVLLIVNPTIETLLFAECRNHKNTCKLACFMYRCRSEKYIRIRTVLITMYEGSHMLSCYPTSVLDDLLSISVSCICSDNMITPDMISKERNRVFIQYIIHNIYSILYVQICHSSGHVCCVSRCWWRQWRMPDTKFLVWWRSEDDIVTGAAPGAAQPSPSRRQLRQPLILYNHPHPPSIPCHSPHTALGR